MIMSGNEQLRSDVNVNWPELMLIWHYRLD
jgi:hypothetical protein